MEGLGILGLVHLNAMELSGDAKSSSFVLNISYLDGHSDSLPGKYVSDVVSASCSKIYKVW